MALARKNRLTKADDFSEIKKRGKRISTKEFVVYVFPNGQDFSRFAVVVSSKLGDSHLRHRIKRIAQEIFRKNETQYIKNIDCILIYQEKISRTIVSSEFEKKFLGLLKKINLISE